MKRDVGYSHILSDPARRAAQVAGVPRYRTGRPCKFGHYGDRYTRNAGCVPCRELTYAKYKKRERVVARIRDGLPHPTRPEPLMCELCSQPDPSGRMLCLDHDHETGAFRGWLCGRCNKALGLLGDNVAGLERGIAYLRRS